MRTRWLLLVLMLSSAMACSAPAEPGAGDATDGPTPSVCADDRGLETVPPMHPSVDDYGTARVALTSADGSCRIELAVLHADTPAERRHGFMEVPDIPSGTGMLFTYPDDPGPRTGGYWMMGTLTPIDIAYIGSDGIVVDIVAMVPCEEGSLAPGERCPTYPPGGAYGSALEVRAGWFDAVGVTPGWRFEVLDG